MASKIIMFYESNNLFKSIAVVMYKYGGSISIFKKEDNDDSTSSHKYKLIKEKQEIKASQFNKECLDFGINIVRGPVDVFIEKIVK